jgi:predicted HTH domain antitoxin
MKSLILEIPSETLVSLKIPRDSIREELLIELATALYKKGALSFGKARQLAAMDRWEFSLELKKRKIPRHYGKKELKEDMEFATESDS